MGKGGDANLKARLPDFSAAEVARHANYKTNKDAWIVYEGQVYDISNFAARHPGGWELITTYEGQDATAVMEAFHPDLQLLRKWLKPLHIGSCSELFKQTKQDPMMQDFHKLTQELRDEGCFESDKSFFAYMYLHIVALELLAFFLVAFCGAHKWGAPIPYLSNEMGWIGTLILAVIQGVANSQGGWLQHDAGHKAIYGKDEKSNFWAQQLTMGCLCGASTNWWKDRHSRHHAKTNIYTKDPDIAGRGLVVFGDVQWQYPTEFLLKPIIPYQAITFVFAAVPSVTTWLFVRPIIWHMMKNLNFYDAMFASTFYLRNIALYYPFVGTSGLLQMYLGLRLIQSFIFTWVTQISHIPCDIILDRYPQDFNWVTMQTQGTLNVAPGRFNDWFTGHLNYQIEHHLWPQMPRHHYAKVAPRVQEFCGKYNLPYIVLPNLFQGCIDVVHKINQTATNFQTHQRHLSSVSNSSKSTKVL